MGVTGIPDEECDDGNLIDNDGCNSQCKLEVCGDGILHAGEECDDGNTDNGDGCSDACVLESACCYECNAVNVSSCTSNAGAFPAQANCDTFALIQCIPAGGVSTATLTENKSCTEACPGFQRCGNSLVDTDIGETCDDGNLINGDGCSDTCLIEPPPPSAVPAPALANNATKFLLTLDAESRGFLIAILATVSCIALCLVGLTLRVYRKKIQINGRQPRQQGQGRRVQQQGQAQRTNERSRLLTLDGGQKRS